MRRLTNLSLQGPYYFMPFLISTSFRIVHSFKAFSFVGSLVRKWFSVVISYLPSFPLCFSSFYQVLPSFLSVDFFFSRSVQSTMLWSHVVVIACICLREGELLLVILPVIVHDIVCRPSDPFAWKLSCFWNVNSWLVELIPGEIIYNIGPWVAFMYSG